MIDIQQVLDILVRNYLKDKHEYISLAFQSGCNVPKCKLSTELLSIVIDKINEDGTLADKSKPRSILKKQSAYSEDEDSESDAENRSESEDDYQLSPPEKMEKRKINTGEYGAREENRACTCRCICRESANNKNVEIKRQIDSEHLKTNLRKHNAETASNDPELRNNEEKKKRRKRT